MARCQVRLAEVLALLKLVSHTDQLSERLRFHLAHNVTAMKFYCFLRHSQLGGDLFIQKPEGRLFPSLRVPAASSSGEHPRRQLSGVAGRSPRVHASSIRRRPDPATAGLSSLNHQLG
jgi:hypothetical protein